MQVCVRPAMRILHPSVWALAFEDQMNVCVCQAMSILHLTQS
jgi:hypothetical protein